MQLFRLKTALRTSIVWCEERTALGDDATEKLGQGALWKNSCLCTLISRKTKPKPNGYEGRGKKIIYFLFFLEDGRGIPKCYLPPHRPLRAHSRSVSISSLGRWTGEFAAVPITRLSFAHCEFSQRSQSY